MDVNVYFRKREINKKCILTTLLGWNMHAKLKILSFLISTAVYPLLYYVIAQRIGSYAGYGGMETAEDYPFTFYCILFLSFATWFILSTAAAQWLLRGGWIGFLALAAGILILQGTVVGKDKRASRDPQPYTEYDSNGNVQEQGNKVVGWKHGKVTTYDENGHIKSIRNFSRGNLTGLCEVFYPDGKIKARGQVAGEIWDEDDSGYRDIPEGRWTYYNEDGSVDDERTYEAGRLTGSKSYALYYDSEKLIRTIGGGLFTGKLEKTGVVNIKCLFPQYITSQVEKGQCEGDYREYYVHNGRFTLAATATLQNGRPEGPLKKYHEDGQLMCDAFYSEGKLDGIYTAYYDNPELPGPTGTIRYTCPYKDGKRHGKACWYYDNGQLKEETEYADGKLHGLSREYGEDGSLISSYVYRLDLKDGAYEEHGKSGGCEKGTYRMGERIRRESFRPDGTLKSIYEWRDGETVRCENYDGNEELI